MKRKTVLIGLNEINFEFLDYYISQGELKNFKKLFEGSKRVETISESEYHLLEPWIQWVTIHTGKNYAEHQVFRLGDIVEHPELGQLFEELEDQGYTVGAISPFNALNKMTKPAFFVPDPWTHTKVSGTGFVKRLYKAIHQAVNDNAKEKISLGSVFTLAMAFLFYVPITSWGGYFKNILKRKLPGTKAMILDNLLADVFIKLWKKSKPDFANLFLNSGAHIQHHYLFNSAAYHGSLENPEWYCAKDYDPFLKVLRIYDRIIERVEQLGKINLIVATGLHQEPHEHLTYYWRLDDHKAFLKEIGIKDYKNVLPRMSRDFLIEFHDEQSAQAAARLMSSLSCQSDGEPVFDVDNRGTSLFIELVYPNQLTDAHALKSSLSNLQVQNFKNYVSFVAIKNGEHNGIGYLASNRPLACPDQIPLAEVKELIMNTVSQS